MRGCARARPQRKEARITGMLTPVLGERKAGLEKTLILGKLTGLGQNFDSCRSQQPCSVDHPLGKQNGVPRLGKKFPLLPKSCRRAEAGRSRALRRTRQLDPSRLLLFPSQNSQPVSFPRGTRGKMPPTHPHPFQLLTLTLSCLMPGTPTPKGVPTSAPLFHSSNLQPPLLPLK